jgi:hypothetical protein
VRPGLIQGQGFLPAVEEENVPKVVAHIGMQAAGVRTPSAGGSAYGIHDRIQGLEMIGYGIRNKGQVVNLAGIQPHVVIYCSLYFPPGAGLQP